jgi:pimeloyl-ACP methyl ester carboxylesterase
MDAPPVQYVKTSDGYSIAYTMRGEGPPLVCLPFVFSHAQAVWSDSSASPLLRALASRFRVVYYDSRGQGLSQRGLTPDTSIDSILLDLHAVLDKLGTNRPVLLGDNILAHVAAHFAARYPDRVAALVLMHCPVSFADHIAWISNMARQNWDFFMGMQVGLTNADGSQPVGRLKRRIEGLKARVTQEDLLSFCGAFARSDVGDVLAKIEAPALVLHPADQKYITQEESARAASLLRNGRLAVLGGPYFFGKPDEALAAIEGLLAAAPPAGGRATNAPIRNLSSREVEVLRLLAAGKSNQEIAETLVISLNTVLRHVSHIYDKTGAANRVQATAYARDHALL